MVIALLHTDCVVSQQNWATAPALGVALASIERSVCCPAFWTIHTSSPQAQALTNLLLTAKSHQRVDRHHQTDSPDTAKPNDVDGLSVRRHIRCAHTDVQVEQCGESFRHVPICRIETDPRVASNFFISVSKRAFPFEQSSYPCELQ